MTTTVTKPAEVGTTMTERVKVILKMNKVDLPLEWLQKFDTQTLLESCGRIEKSLGRQVGVGANFQREFIQNPLFADFYTKLLSTITNGEISSVHLQAQIGHFLPAFWALGRDIAESTVDNFLEALDVYPIEESGRLIYLDNFAGAGLTEGAVKIVVKSLSNCIEVPAVLTKEQKDFLQEPFVGRCELCNSAPFTEVFNFLADHPDLLSLTRLLYEKQVDGFLTMNEYRQFAEPGADHAALITEIVTTLPLPALRLFFAFWEQNGYKHDELKAMKRLLAARPDEDWEHTLSTRVGYINALYGAKFKTIDLSEMDSKEEAILLYAIIHNKNHFIRLVDEHAESFCSLPSSSILLDKSFYEEHFNLNELTEKDLTACRKMVVSRFHPGFYAQGRQYTFPEIQALHGRPEPYWNFYHALTSDSQDYRLLVFRQVCKRALLDGLDDNEVAALAVKLIQKPLADWMRAEFSHIDGIQAKEGVRLLAHWDQCRHLLPSMKTQLDVLIALRSLDSLTGFGSIEELKADLTRTDPNWGHLAEKMELSEEFQNQNKDNILLFLCRDGANIAMKYMDCLNNEHKAAYMRVIKAELMGRFRELKYHKGDLSRELAIQLPEPSIEIWKNNTQTSHANFQIEERDDFFSTMLAGVVPQRTCLSYVDGAYRDCLLAGFDSNKKLLYAGSGGNTLGRAYLRLTKAHTGGNAHGGSTALTFVDVENPSDSSLPASNPEQPVLFLERPYISHAAPRQTADIIRALLHTAEQKAEKMGVMLVASDHYAKAATDGFVRTRLSLYISKSKAGRQYLDSLNGQATASDEGSYVANSFLAKRVTD